MATIADLQVKIGADIRELQRKLSRAQNSIRSAGKSMQRVGRNLTLAVTAPLAGMGGMALKTAADFESLRQSMNILNGSVEEGARNFERLQEFSATTPFQLNELAEAQNMLQGFGLAADEAFDSMRMIGDIAAVASGNIKGIGIAFGQAAAEGRLMTRDIRQLINQGVPAIKLLADTMGVAQSEVLDLASQGEISFEILQQAMRDATSEGGMFANGMAKQAQTLAGRFSTMKDNINLALGSIGDTMSGLAKGVMNQVISMAQAFRNLSQSTKQMITTAGLLAAALPPLIFLAGKLTVVFSALISPIGLAIAAIGGLIVIGKNMIDNWDVIAVELQNLWDGIKLAAWTIVDGIFSAFQWMGTNILGVLSRMAAVASPALVGPLEAAKGQIKAAGAAIEQTLKESRNEFGKSGEAAVEARKDMVSLSDSFWSITDAIQGGLTSGLSFLSDQLFQVAQNAKAAKQEIIELATVRHESATQEEAEEKKGLAGMTAATTRFRSAAETAFGKTFQQMAKMKAIGGEIRNVVTQFTDSFGKGLSNVIVQGKRVVDVLKNIGNLLVSSVIQRGLKLLLTGGLSGVGGFFGSGGGLFGAIGLADGGLAFGPTLAVVGDNRGARSNPEVIAPLSKLQGMMSGQSSVEVEGTIKGDVIHIANKRGQNKFR